MAEAYFTGRRDRFSTLAIMDDSHNSVNGLRLLPKLLGMQERVKVVFIPCDIDSLRVNEAVYADILANNEPGLVVLTAQSNLSGVKHDFGRLADLAKVAGWDVGLDAAALVATTPLDLKQAKSIDFTCVSWYKVLGCPTGVGSLIVRQSVAPTLTLYFGLLT